jgi:hypothetical protein
MPALDLVGGTGLAADDIAGRVDHLAGAVEHDHAQQLPHMLGGLGRNHPGAVRRATGR